MKPRFVAGLFYVSMEVTDGGTPVSTITTKTLNAEHVVTVENISTLPRDVHVFNSLPNGTSHLEFVKSPPCNLWDKQVAHIPSGSTRSVLCQVKRNGGTAGVKVPFQLNRILERLNGSPWSPITSPAIPFDIDVIAG